MSSKSITNYNSILTDLKNKIRQARFQASLTVNAQLLALYWEIGKTILQQRKEGWGSNVIGRLAKDLRAEFPDMKGLSDRNLVYMQTFAGAYSEITQQPVAKLKKSKPKKGNKCNYATARCGNRIYQFSSAPRCKITLGA